MEKQNKKRVRKPISKLTPGELIYANIPFEENTADYYNGYDPLSIRGQTFVNRRGESGKVRCVVFMGLDEGNLLYLPITSRSSGQADQYHQYLLKNNSAINPHGRHPKSYVEASSLRAIPVTPSTSLSSVGHVDRLDMRNINHRLAQYTLQLTTIHEQVRHVLQPSIRDYRGLIPDNLKAQWREELLKDGFTPRPPHKGKEIYAKGNATISRNDQGLIFHHKQLSRLDVSYYVSKREGRTLPPLPEIDFEQSVEVLSRSDNTHDQEGKL